MRQKAAPTNAAQGRLDAYPPHPCGQIRVARRKHGSILRLPPAFGAFQRRCKSVGGQVLFTRTVNTQRQIPASALPRPQGYGRELQHAHHFITLRRISWGKPRCLGSGVCQCGGAVVAACAAAKRLHRSQKAHRQCAVLLLSAYRIVYRAGTMASLVKGQGGSQRHAVSFHAQTLQEACHMAVVADVVGAAPIQRHCRRGGKGKRFASKVCHGDTHQLHRVLPGGHKRGHGGFYAKRTVGALDRLPQKPAVQHDLVRPFAEARRLLGRALPGGAPQRSVGKLQPEIARRTAFVQSLLAARSQQKSILPCLAVACQPRCNAADDAALVGKREIGLRRLISVGQYKIAVGVQKFQLRHSTLPHTLYLLMA